MAFDKKRYEAEYLRKQDAKRGLVGGLDERYAIDLSQADADIAEQIRAVRSYWNRVRLGTRLAAVVAICKSEDERLKSEFGEQMLQRAWWEARLAERPTSVASDVELLLAQGQLGAARWAARGLKLANGRIAVMTRIDSARKQLETESAALQARLEADNQVQEAILAGESAVEKERRLLSAPATVLRNLEQPRVPASSVFGIDLGATYTAVAYIDDEGKPVIARNAMGMETTPCAIYFENESSVVVGDAAKETAKVVPDSVVLFTRREMGDPDYLREFFGREYSAPALSALILRAVAEAAEADSGRKLERAVITVPAYLGMAEKAATREAGELAGIEVLGVLPEPVAACLACGLDGGEQKTVLVYDLGGGTFDVTVIRLGTDEIRVLAVDGDHLLGGADWDKALVEHILNEVTSQLGDDSIRDDSAAVQEIWNQAEKAKQQLSKAESRKVIVRHSGGAAVIEISRTQFEEMTKSLLDSTIEITKCALETLERSHPGATGEISELVLVGGASQMPAVGAALRREFAWEPTFSDPEFAVAKGAALYGAHARIGEISVTAGADGDSSGERAPEDSIAV